MRKSLALARLFILRIFTMTYYVYENWINPRAKVHFANCYCCDYGRGQFGGTDPKRGRWSRQFDSFDAAWEYAVRSEYPESLCKKCNPK